MGGQRSRTAWASFSPSMLPGRLMSVNNTAMSLAGLQQCRCFVRIGGFQRDEACILDYFDGQHAQQWFILNDQNNSPGFWPDVIHWVRQLRNSRFAWSE